MHSSHLPDNLLKAISVSPFSFLVSVNYKSLTNDCLRIGVIRNVTKSKIAAMDHRSTYDCPLFL